MVFFKLNQQHVGKFHKDFPFNAVDMARFILRVLNKTLPNMHEEISEEQGHVINTVHRGVLNATINELKRNETIQNTKIKEL